MHLTYVHNYTVCVCVCVGGGGFIEMLKEKEGGPAAAMMKSSHQSLL